METYTSNLLNMIRATLLYCTQNAAATAAIIAFAAAQAAAQAKVVLIDALNQIATATTTGVTLDTKALRTSMTTVAFKCASALKAYAISTNNQTLLAIVNYTLTDLDRLKKEDIDDICQAIHDAALTNIAAAAAFGYDATDVTDLQTAISLYRTSIHNPRQAIITKSQANKQIKELTRSIIDTQFKGMMDNMVNTLKATNPNFHSGYYQAREIIDLGSSHAKIRGTVRNPQGTLLAGVRVWITLTGQTTPVKETLTNPLGKYTLNQIPAENYDIHYQLDGYNQFTEPNLHIPAGKEITRNITLPYITFYTGQVPPNGYVNIFSNLTPVWRIGVTILIKNITNPATPTLIWVYSPNTPTDPGPGSGDVQLTNGQEFQHTFTAPDFKPCLSFFNQSTDPATYEITVL